MTTTIQKIIANSISIKNQILEDEKILLEIENVIQSISQAFTNHKKVLFCGNGGSASDAQHLAAEFSGRFYLDRKALHAEALHCNTSYLTAVANDYSYEDIYSRMIDGIGNRGDVLIGISTSGNSKNIVRALEAGKRRGMITVGLTGEGGGKMKEFSDHLICVPSKDTPRIQESHGLIGHVICELVEKQLFSNSSISENR